MLEVAKVDELVFQLGHLVPREPALRAGKVETVHRAVDHLVTERPVLQDFGSGVGLGNQRQAAVRVRRPRNAVRVLYLPLVTLLRTKCGLVRVEVQMREEERVIRHLPELVGVIAAQPHGLRTPLDRFSKHGEAAWYWLLSTV